MNIRSIANILAPVTVTPKERTARDTSADRDPSSDSGQGEPQKRKMTEEDLKSAIEYLTGLQGVKDHNLSVRLDQRDGIVVVYIEDPTGKAIRRIPEAELSQLNRSQSSTKGQILNKAM